MFRYILVIITVFYNQSTDAFMNLSNPSMKFLNCEHIEDDTFGLKINEKTAYSFFFNTSFTFDSYIVETCVVNKSLVCINKHQESNCKSKSEIISCGVIKDSVDPIIKRDSKVDLKVFIHGKNQSARYKVLENYHTFKRCELRGCKGEIDAVKLVEDSQISWKPRTKELQFKLENIPGYTTKNVYDRFNYSVILLNDTHKLYIDSQDLTNKDSIEREKEYSLNQGSCISFYDQLCVITDWTYCDGNREDLWQTVKLCKPFSYANYLPKFKPSCDKNVVSLSLSESTSQALFYDFLFKSKESGVVSTFKTKNLTIPLSSIKGDIISVQICDDCACSATVDVSCEISNIPKSSNNDIDIIIGVTIPLVAALIIFIGCFFWKQSKRKALKDEIDLNGDDLACPNNEYTDPEPQKQNPHKYFDVSKEGETPKDEIDFDMNDLTYPNPHEYNEAKLQKSIPHKYFSVSKERESPNEIIDSDLNDLTYPNQEYVEAELQKQKPHKYINVTTQEHETPEIKRNFCK